LISGWRILNATKKDVGERALDPAQRKSLSCIWSSEKGVSVARMVRDFMTTVNQRNLCGRGYLSSRKRLDPELPDIAEMKQRFLLCSSGRGGAHDRRRGMF